MKTTKIISLALVLAMIVSAFGMMMPMAGAEIVDEDNDRGLEIWTTTLYNYDSTNPGDEFWNYPIYPGSQGVSFDITIYNDGETPPIADDNPIRWANLSINTLLMNEAGTLLTTTTNPVTWIATRDDAMENITEGNIATYTEFEFNVKTNAVPGIYDIIVVLDYMNSAQDTDYQDIIGYIRFEIRHRVSFDDVIGLLPGDLNVPVNMDANFDTNMGSGPDQDNYVDELTVSFTLQNTGFWWFGESTATLTRTNDGSFYGGWTWYMEPRVSVSPSMKRGEYPVSYTITYTTSDGDIVCTETGTIMFHVGDLPMLEVTVATSTIAQGATSATWALTFTNVGTVDLVDIYVQLDEMYDFFFYTVSDHWEDDQMVSDAMISLGDIDMGDTATATMEVGVNPNIPVGEHKVMFYFEGWYYEPTSSDFVWVEVDWTGTPAYPRVNNMGLPPTTSAVEGPYIDITVTDTVLDITLSGKAAGYYGYSVNTPALSGQIMDFPLYLDVVNTGYIPYSNMLFQVETNTADSPFLNVVDPAATLSEGAQLGYLDVEDQSVVMVNVNLAPDADPGVYMVPVTVTAVNEQLRESITTEITARVTILGIGPQLEVTTVAPETIKPGEAFTLTITITNVGDDTARNIIINTAILPANDETTVDGNYAEPQAGALPLFVGDLAPGATLNVEISMMSNSDMADGHVYPMVFAMDYVDSAGNGPSTSTFQVSVKATGGGGSVIGTFYWMMIVLSIVIMIVLIIVAIVYVKKSRQPKVAAEYYQPQNQPPPPPQDGMVEP